MWKSIEENGSQRLDGGPCLSLGFQVEEGIAITDMNQHNTLSWQEQESPVGCSGCWYQRLLKRRQFLVKEVRILVPFLRVISGARGPENGSEVETLMAT